MKEFDVLKAMIEACSDDVTKATSGNRAAGTRVRKAMQGIKNQAQLVRGKILELRD